MTRDVPIHVVGAGLAGSEAAWQIAERGLPVVLHEMRPTQGTPAHKTGKLAELVCSNSFRSDDAANNAVGLLHAEMRRLGSLIMRAADANQVVYAGWYNPQDHRSNLGIYVRLRHANGYDTWYGHMSALAVHASIFVRAKGVL